MLTIGGPLILPKSFACTDIVADLEGKAGLRSLKGYLEPVS